MIELKRGALVHAVPGRARVRLARTDLTDEFGQRLRSALLSIPGVREVSCSNRTGSVVIEYDQAQLDMDGLTNLARAANVLAIEAGGEDRYARRELPQTELAERIQRTFHEVDLRLSELTDGRWDLRTLVPVTFGVLAARQLLRDVGQIGSAPWYVLAWYAFDSFLKLQQNRDRPAEPSSDSTLILPPEHQEA